MSMAHTPLLYDTIDSLERRISSVSHNPNLLLSDESLPSPQISLDTGDELQRGRHDRQSGFETHLRDDSWLLLVIGPSVRVGQCRIGTLVHGRGRVGFRLQLWI